MTDLPDNREVYPNAPLKLVACELRMQLAPGVDVAAAAAPFYDDVEADYPLQGPSPEQGFRVDFSAIGPVPAALSGGFRYLTREKTRSVTVTSSALVVETSAYTRFEDFSDQIGRVIDALGQRLKIVSVERIGLRYIDELPVADLPGQTTDGFFAPSSLACGTAVPGLGEPAEFLSTSSYPLGADRHAVMRAGRVNQPIVAANGPLRIPHPSTSPLFVIDVDCSWTAVDTPPLAFESGIITEVLADLHKPVRALFEHTITDKLRNNVLRKEGTAA